MEVSIENSQNQIKTVFVDQPGSPSASIQLWFNAGSALEEKEDWGVAHFLEHMFFKGTPKRPGIKIAYETESFGGEINAFTSFDYTCYFINSPYNKINQALNILLDMVSNPLFSNEDIPAEKEVVFEEYLRSQDSAQQFSFQKLQSQVFSKGYSHPILGSQKHIKNFNKKQITNFRKKHYNKSNLTIVIGGDLKNKKTLLNTINKYQMPKGKPNSFPELKVKKKASIDFNEKDVEMVSVSYVIGANSISHDDSPFHDLAWNCIGSGESSTLYQELVQKDSLCNNATTFSYFFKTSGMHMLKINVPLQNLEEALGRVESFVNRMRTEGVTKDVLEKIKNQYLASKVYEKESLEQYVFSVGHSITQFQDHKSDEKFLAKAGKATLKEVNKAINDIFSRPLHISTLFPLETINDKNKKSLNLHFKKLNEKKATESHKSVKAGKSQKDQKIKLYEPKKGIRLIYRENNITPTFSFHAYIKAGLSNETPEINGSYHQISNMLVQGHSGIDVNEYKTQIEKLASTINGFAGKNAYGLTCHGQTKDYDELIQHFKGCLLNSNFDENVLKNELSISLRYLDAMEKDPTKKCFELISKTLFKEHPYAYNVIGNRDSLNKLSTTSLRDLHQKNLNEKELVFFYGGPQSPEEIIDLVLEITESLPERTKFDFPKINLTREDEKSHFLEMDREQTHLFMGTPISDLSNDLQTFYKILSAHLSGQSSHLFVQMRDELGLCYVVQPVHFSALQCGYWGIYMASGTTKAAEAIATLKVLTKDLAQNGISQKDLTRVKEYIQGQALLNIQTNDDYGSTYSIPHLHHLGIDFFYKEIDRIQKFSVEKFNRILKKELTKDFQFFAVGKENPFN